MENKQNTESNGSDARRPARKRYATVPTAEKLADLIHWLEEHKAGQIVSIDLSAQGVFTDALVVVTAGPRGTAKAWPTALRPSVMSAITNFCAWKAMRPGSGFSWI